MRIEKIAYQVIDTTEASTTALSYTRIERLVETASSDGLLSREEEEIILAAIVSSQNPTAEICALFRILQERVWNGELMIEN